MLEEMLLSVHGDQQRLLGHLATCPYCQWRLSGLSGHFSCYLDFPKTSPGVLGARVHRLSADSLIIDYGKAINRSERVYLERARELHRERTEAPGLLADLLALSWERR